MAAARRKCRLDFLSVDNGQTVSALAPSHYADLCDGACYNDARVEVAAFTS